MAIGMTFLVSICLFIAPPFLLSVLSSPLVTPPPLLQPWLEYIVPVLRIVVAASAAPRLWDILLTGFDGNAIGFQVLANLGAGAVLFGLAWLLFDPCNRNLDDEVRKAKPVLNMIGQRKGSSRRAWRLALVGKDFRSLAGGWSMMLAKFGGYAALIVLIVYALNDFRWFRVDPAEVGEMMTIMTFYILLPIESMVIACRLFRTEIKEQTWPLLLSLPLSLPEIAYAKVAGALIALVPCAFFFWLGALLDAGGFADMLVNFLDEPNFFLLFALYFSHLVLFMHLTTLFSLLANAWAGALLAIFAAFIGAWVNAFAVNIPLILLQTSPGGMGLNRDQEMIYYAVAMVISLAVVLLLVACVHILIGARLKSAAAQ
jgi:ABC-type transport system involved in multi-copper enzyme maturation permease subunit